MSLAEEKKVCFYQLLGVTKDANQKQIKKAYRKAALRLHPDHNKSEDATTQFQQLAKAHKVLSDPAKREYYDKYGEVDESEMLDTEDFDQAYAYWRSVFPKITADDIQKFKEKYIGSKMEDEDLIEQCQLREGDMSLILQCVPFAEPGSAKRLYSRALKLIKAGKIPKKLKKKLRQTWEEVEQEVPEDEAEEAMEAAKELGVAGLFGKENRDNTQHDGVPDGLAALILSRKRDREGPGGFLSSLEAKYCGNSKKKNSNSKKKKKKKVKAVEPSDEEFAAIQKKMMAGRQA